MAILTGVPRIRVDDLVAGGDVGALGDVATVQNSVWYETRMFWLQPTFNVLRDTDGFADLFRITAHRPLGYDTVRLFVHVDGTGGGPHGVRITINGDTNTYNVPANTPIEFFVPLNSSGDLQRVRVEIDVVGAGANNYTVTTCLVLDGEEQEGPLVLTFGSADADFLTYADLPSDAPDGAWAVDVRTPGATYRAHVKFGRTWWIPSVAYGDGTGFVLLAACDGSEDAIALGARGLTPAQNGTGAITYQPGSAQAIRLATTVGVGVASLSTADYAGAPTNYDSDTDTWIVFQRQNVGGGGAGGFARIALITQDWQVRYGRRISDGHDRLFRDGNNNLNATTNYLSGVSNLSPDADTDTVELIRRTQPAGTAGAGGDRIETRRSGDGYLSVIGPTQGGGAAWLAFAGAQSESGSSASMDVRAFLVVVRP